MALTNLFLKVELEHNDEERPEALGDELCRHVMKFYGVRSCELSNFAKIEE
jgi:hypothetical protein